MNLPQIIKSESGKPEFALIPVAVYRKLKYKIEHAMTAPETSRENDYIAFRAEHYISNPVALARIRVRATQQQLAQQMGVSQAYISKIEAQGKITAKVLEKVDSALADIRTSANKNKKK